MRATSDMGYLARDRCLPGSGFWAAANIATATRSGVASSVMMRFWGWPFLGVGACLDLLVRSP